MNNIYYCNTINLFKKFKINKFKIKKRNFLEKLTNIQCLKTTGLIITPSTQIENEQILKMKNLKFIFIMGLHKITKINLSIVKKKTKILYFNKNKNIKILNKITPTPEFIIGLIFLLARNLNFFYKNKKKLHLYSKFNNSNFFEKMISNSSLGIIGYGRIGKKLSTFAIKFGMKVFVYAPNKKIRNNRLTQVLNIKTLAKKSDFISNNASLNNNNYNFLNKNFFVFMKKNSFFINTAKGDHVNMDHLCEFITKKKISGAAIDVYSKENNKLITSNTNIKKALKVNQNLIFTPHIAGATTNDRMILQKRMFFLIKKHLSVN